MTHKLLSRLPTDDMITAATNAWKDRIKKRADAGNILEGEKPEIVFLKNYQAMYDAAPEVELSSKAQEALDSFDYLMECGDLLSKETVITIRAALMQMQPNDNPPES